MMDEERYRNELRDHFMGQVKNSKLQKYCSSTLTDNCMSSRSKDHTWRAQQQLQQQQQQHQFQHQKQQQQQQQHQHQHQQQHQQQQQQQQQHKLLQETQKHMPQPRSSGGDAECLLYDSVYTSQGSGESFRQRSSDSNYTLHQIHPKHTTPRLTLTSSTSTQKYCSDDCNERFLYETDSNLGGIGDGSEDSAKTHKTSKTVVSRRSSQELRKMVKSKCKLHEEIDRTLKQISQNIDMGGVPTSAATVTAATASAAAAIPSTYKGAQCLLKGQEAISHCKRCTGTMKSSQMQKDSTTEMAKDDFKEYRNGELLTISVDDVVNSKVINPMIRKLQRMYLNNLKDEMSLMEELERLPHKVNEVYKATIFKQKD